MQQENITAAEYCSSFQLNSDYLGMSNHSRCVAGNRYRLLLSEYPTVSVSFSSNLQSIYFDAFGRPRNHNNERLCVAEPCKISFFTSDANNANLCLNSEGYIYACD